MGHLVFPARIGAAEEALRPLVRDHLGDREEARAVPAQLVGASDGTAPELPATAGAIAWPPGEGGRGGWIRTSVFRFWRPVRLPLRYGPALAAQRNALAPGAPRAGQNPPYRLGRRLSAARLPVRPRVTYLVGGRSGSGSSASGCSPGCDGEEAPVTPREVPCGARCVRLPRRRARPGAGGGR